MRLLVALAVFVVAALVADGLAAGQLESRAAEAASEGLGAPAEVSVPDRPLLLHLLRGRLPVVRVEARGVPLEGGVRLARLSIALHGVHVGLADLRGKGFPRSDGGSFLAELDPAAFGALADGPRGLDNWRIEDGRLVATLDSRTVPLTLFVEAGRLVLVGPDGLAVSLPVLDLARLPGDAGLERARLTPRAVELSGWMRTR